MTDNEKTIWAVILVITLSAIAFSFSPSREAGWNPDPQDYSEYDSTGCIP